MFDIIKYSFCGARSVISGIQRTPVETGERSLALDSIDAEIRRDSAFHASVFEAIKNNGGYFALAGFSFSGILSLISTLNPYLKLIPIAILSTLFVSAGYSKAVSREIETFRSEIQGAGFNLINREFDAADAILIGDIEIDQFEVESDSSASDIEEEVLDDDVENDADQTITIL
jgi:hypothetical protein